MKAVLFGSVGAVTDTSERQRAAFNQAFVRHSLDWRWEQAQYRRMLRTSGGQGRIESYARARGETVDAAAVHRTKSALFQEDLRENGITPRRGVVELIDVARTAGVVVGFVTTTEAATVDAISAALASAGYLAFDIITTRADGMAGKPAPDAYKFALEKLGINAADAVAVEDNPGGVAAAQAAGIFTIGFPGENTRAEDLSNAEIIAHSDINLSACDMVLGRVRVAG